MQISIGKSPIKIACLQTIPGKELNVKEDLDRACRKLKNEGKIGSFSFFKGFGTFDIILIYTISDYGSQLREGGPINNIIKSNIWLCYSIHNGLQNNLFQQLENYAFSAFCLVKLNSPENCAKESFTRLLGIANKKGSKLSILGTLGWNELIIIISGNKLNKISKAINTISNLPINIGKIIRTPILKTLSFIGLNYDLMPPISREDKTFEQTKSFFERNSLLKDSIVSNCGSGIDISIDITTRPSFINEIKKYFEKKDFEIVDSIGIKDLIVRPKLEKMSWSHLLSTILHFRYDFRTKAIATHTRMFFIGENAKKIFNPTSSDNIDPFTFDYKNLKDVFGAQLSSTLSSYFYTLNALFQDTLISNAFYDMRKYPGYIKATGEKLKKKNRTYLSVTQRSRKALRNGAELRSYGTYYSLEEVTGRFSEYKGGCQISLLALEQLITYVFDGIGMDWMGFIITSDPKFYTIDDVIAVPNETLWQPEKWWAIYHEIAHVIINNKPILVNSNDPALKQYLFDKNFPDFQLNLAIELAAEVIGFEIGFYGDYDQFLKLLWRHLSKINKFQEDDIPIEHYAIRTFFVELFQGHFRKLKGVDRIYKADIDDLDVLYIKFLDHIEKIENIVDDKKLFKEKKFFAADNTKTFKDLYRWAKKLADNIDKIDLRPSMAALKYPNTDKVYTYIIEGKIWWGDIISPDAVLHKFMKKKNLSPEQKLALILSFWNSYNNREINI